jgi:NADH-quinone oxidoreductase subunit G
MPKLTIDGEEFEVEPGTTILQAALTRGRVVPHYCYHPGLSIAGNCRMCLVEVEKAPKLVIACQSQVADGMVVNTLNDRVKEAQRAVMEFLLINHPLDCPICDQAGECKLQDYAVSHGTGVSRYTEPKLALAKAVDIGPHVMLDQERCIQCSRCTRFCDEITGTGELAFFQRGARSMIGTFPGKRLDNPYSGNVVDLCPVGALTLKEFRFATRVWYLKNTPTVCAGCSRGCNVMVATGTQRDQMTTRGQQDEGIKRIVPRFNESVNGHWICDDGRLSYRRMEQAERLAGAAAPAGTTMEWDAAVRRAAEALRQAAGAGKAAAIFSPRLTSESIFAWKRLLEALGGALTGVRRLESGADDRLLIRADKGANSTGAAWLLGADATEGRVQEALARGDVETLLVLGDTLDPADSATLDDRLRGKVKELIYVGPFLDAAARNATMLLPAAAWAEEDGTIVNFEGRIQRLRRARLPRGEGRPGWRVASDLAQAAGVDWPAWSVAGEVLAELGGEAEAWAGLDEDRIGMLGVVVASTAAGAS